MADSTKINLNHSYRDATNGIGSTRGVITEANDGSKLIDSEANGHVIHIMHVPTNTFVQFKAFLTQWNDTFSQEWESTPIYGRMDAVQTFKRTTRKISFAWDAPAGNLNEAGWNFAQAERLMQMSYPTFENAGYINATGFSDNAINNSPVQADLSKEQNRAISGPQKTDKRNVSIMSSPPIFKIKFSTWLANSSENPEVKTEKQKQQKGKPTVMLPGGLYGTINSLSFSPKFGSDDSGFYSGNDVNEGDAKPNILIPKSLSFNCDFTVIHANPLGYDADTGIPRTESFPYSAQRIYKNLSSKKIVVK